MLLHEVECHGEQEHRDNDEKATKITAQAGDRSGRYQKRNERIENALADFDEESLPMNGFEQVKPVGPQAFGGFSLGQSG
jgi:hypothetical protein